MSGRWGRLLGLLLALAPGAAARGQNLEHVVETGESLSSISARSEVYADPFLWPLIYKFNRDQIKDPALIYPGQRLQIPMDVDSGVRAETRVQGRSAGAARME